MKKSGMATGRRLVILFAVASFCCGAASAVTVTNAMPAATAKLATTNTVMEWTFEGADDFQGWRPFGDLANNTVTNGTLNSSITGVNPGYLSPPFEAKASAAPFVVVRLKVQHAGHQPLSAPLLLQLFWLSSSITNLQPAASVSVETLGDEQWHDYTFAVSENKLWQDTITLLRLDPGHTPDVRVSIDYVRLQTIPGKDYGALFKARTYEAQVLENLNVLVYVLEKGARLGKPITISNRMNMAPRGQDPKDMVRFAVTGHPQIQSHKMVIHAQSDHGIPLVQTWKFSDSAVAVENEIKNYPVNEPFKWVCTFITWPCTHTFAPSVEKAEREKATRGYSWRAHYGKTYTTLKTVLLPYTHAIEPYVFDWVENRGPWGATHTAVLKRKPGLGNLGIIIDPNHATPADGMEMIFVGAINGTVRRMDLQGFELSFK